MAGKRKYPDLRYLFMRGLINHERDQRCHSYLKSAAECTSRAIVSLELSDEPVRSVKQARRLAGIGGETCTRLTKIDKEKEYSCLKPLPGHFVSSAGGILVALLDATEQLIYNGKSADKGILVPEDDVKRRANRLTEEQFTDGPDRFCKAWWRVEVLIKRGYIRRRSQKKIPVLELLPIGKVVAVRLRGHTGLTTTVPASHKIPELPSSLQIPSLSRDTTAPASASFQAFSLLGGEVTLQKPELEDALYTNDRGHDGIVMLVDRREMGGERAGLGELCGLLGDNGICYKTQHLKAGDYTWVWRRNGKEIVLPCLVERKRADDIACTLKEGRFWGQVNRMKDWKREFTERGVPCSLHYILEGRPEQYVVKCEDGCMGIIRCGNPTLAQVKLVIEDLKRHPDLLVKETDNLNITVILLTSLTAELKERVKKGDFDNLLLSALSDKKQELLDVGRVATSSYTAVEAPTAVSTGQNAREQLVDDLDEDMRIAIELSRKEMVKTQNMLNDMRGIDFESNEGLLKADIVKKSPINVDEDEDAELAAVLEKSKYETHGRHDHLELTKSEPLPLMQYHCTEGGSIHLTGCSRQEKTFKPNTYRPKINRKPAASTSTLTDNFTNQVESDESKHFKGFGIYNYKLIDVESINPSESDYITGSKYTHTDLEVKSKTDQDAFCMPESEKLVKRKWFRKDFNVRPDENNVEEFNNDAECPKKKKQRKVPFCFTPSMNFIENNVLHATRSRDSHLDKTFVDNGNECCENNERRPGKVNEMRKERDDLLVSTDSVHSSLCTEKVKGNHETKEGMGILETNEATEYDCGDDLFAGDEALGFCDSLNELDERYRRRNGVSSSYISEVNAKSIKKVEAEAVDGGLSTSLSLDSDSDESLPDVGLGDFADKKRAGENISVVDNVCRNKEEFNTVIGKNCDRTEGRSCRFDSGYDSDTRPDGHGNETENKVGLVVSVLPHIAVCSAREMLKRCKNNVEMCIAGLLERNNEKVLFDFTDS